VGGGAVVGGQAVVARTAVARRWLCRLPAVRSGVQLVQELAGSDEVTVHDLLEEGAEQARAWCEDVPAVVVDGRPCCQTSGPDRPRSRPPGSASRWPDDPVDCGGQSRRWSAVSAVWVQCEHEDVVIGVHEAAC
jgi:hypothetical protein